MPAKIRDLDRMLTGKLNAESSQGHRHTRYRIFNDTTLVATTILSRSYEEVDNSLMSSIARQLLIERKHLAALLDCTWQRQEYIEHVLKDD